MIETGVPPNFLLMKSFSEISSVGLAIYCFYGFRNSNLRKKSGCPPNRTIKEPIAKKPALDFAQIN